MISGGEVESHIQCSSEGPEEVGYKFGSVIGHDIAWDTILGEDMKTK